MESKEVFSQLNLKANVEIRVRNKETGKIVKSVSASNRVTTQLLAGIANLIYGDTEILDRYVPAYIAVGDCTTPSTGANVSPVSVAVTDSMLYGEIPLNSTGINERIKVSAKSITNNGDYVMVGMNGYIHSNTYTEKEIKEVGLFTKKSGNNCLARVILDEPISKGISDVIDIVWGITSTSVANN